jgi:hypothetical protein
MASELEAEAEAEEAGGAPPDIPTKVVSSPINVTVRARILMFDFDGRSGERTALSTLSVLCGAVLCDMYWLAFGSQYSEQIAGLVV